MNTPVRAVPAEIVILLVAFFTQTATEEQKNGLDDWICANDDNMRFFEHCVEQNCQPLIHNPDLAKYELSFPPIELN